MPPSKDHLSLAQELFSWRFIKFCCVGASNCLVDFLIYLFLLWVGLSPFLARIISWIMACLFSFVLNKLWTFKAEDKGAMPLLRFIVVNALSLSLGVLLLYLFKVLGCSNEWSFIFSLPFTTLANYFGYRLWVFRQLPE